MFLRIICILWLILIYSGQCACAQLKPAEQQGGAERPALWAQSVPLDGVPNLFKVSDTLYRSAQPTSAGMQELKKLGIKTVLNLRAFHSDSDEIGETDLAGEQISMFTWYPQQKEAVKFLQMVSAADKQPVLVHCHYGADRTGAMTALYRVAIEGWTKEEAIREMTEGGYGFHAIWFNLPNWIREMDIDAICQEAGIKPAAPRTPVIRADVFVIEVLDAETKHAVPLVELETIAHNRFVTDNTGCVAVTDADLMGRKVFFFVRSHGYQFAKDGFGIEGKALDVVAGEKVTLSINRRNLAERLYRLTGSGLNIEAAKAGLVSGDYPLVPGDVIGCDSVMTALFQDKLYWFWGDTNRPHYPIGGNFHITGATTPVDLAATIDQGPPKFDYFVDDEDVVRSVAKMPGEGPTWISAVTVFPATEKSQPRMVANYVKVRNQLEAYRWGFVAWDNDAQQFKELISTDKRPSMFPPSQVHTFMHPDQGEPYVYFCHPLPLTRVRASESAFIDPTQYEGYTCLKEGTLLTERQIERDNQGKVKFGWKRNTLPLTQRDQQELVKVGLLMADEARIVLTDIQSDRRVLAHSGSVAWNKYRQRWIAIFVELGGESSHLGEVWYAESPAPEGPWSSATKILSHDRYSFYNPKHHPYFDSEDGRMIYFEGTYTTTFSGNPHPTPRYDYNQILYRLDLSRNHHPD